MRGGFVAASAWALWMVGCVEARTQLMVRVEASPEAWAMARSFVVHAAWEGSSAPLVSRCFDRDATASRPRELGVVPADGDDPRPLRVRVTLHGPPCRGELAPEGSPLLEHRAEVRFQKGRTSLLRVVFSLGCLRPEGCAPSSCAPADSTCQGSLRGACERVCVAREVPDYAPPSQGLDAGLDVAGDARDDLAARDVTDAGDVRDVTDAGDVRDVADARAPCAQGCANCVAGHCVRVLGVSAAGYHTCAVVEGEAGPGTSLPGSVWCWGANESGQVGPPHQEDQPVPRTISFVEPGEPLQVATGVKHSCALTARGASDQALWCWGYNGNGELGLAGAGETLHPEPQRVTLPERVTAVFAGVQHTCVRTTTARAVCWGDQFGGKLGDGVTAGSQHRPSLALTAPGVPATGIASLALGEHHTCALHADATVRCWGDNARGQLGAGDTAARAFVPTTSVLADAVEVVAGAGHTCARLRDGTARCWGANNVWQCGDGGTTFANRPRPVAVADLARATALAAGHSHTCALVEGGAVWCWGGNQFGQLGDGTLTARARPVPVLGLTGAVAVSAGFDHTCARLASGALVCWGSDGQGQLGAGTTVQRTPTPVADTTSPGGMLRVAQLAMGRRHACATLRDGSARCWGRNVVAEAGPPATLLPITTPRVVLVQAGGLARGNLVAVAAGEEHSCAVTAAGAVQCWTIRTDLRGRDGERITAGATRVAASRTHDCAVVSGRVRCWGERGYGALGDGLADDADAAVSPATAALPDASVATAVSTGDSHTCAVVDGRAWCWGLNGLGQLGAAEAGFSSPRPLAVTLFPGAAAEVASGVYFTCARFGGDVRCWGDLDLRGVTPGAPALTGATALAAGARHACAATATGVSCWGDNAWGQLGTGDLRPRDAPAAVTALALPAGVRVTALALGGDSSCAVLSDDSVRCWGRNSEGNLGNGVAGWATRPAPVVWR